MKDIKFAKLLVLLNGAVPVALLGIDAFRHQLGANPVNFAIRTTGLLSLIFLLLSLTTTPLGRITGWRWLTQTRRTLGLYAFFHAALHFAIFFVFDRALSIGSTFSEMLVRPYLTIGSAGLLMMVPLAVTSTNGMIKRLGAARWKQLHRLAYPAAVAGALHYYMLVKADVRQPVAFATLLAILLGYRLLAHYLKLRTAYQKSQAAPVPTNAATTKPRFWSGQLVVAQIFVETPEVRTFRLVSTTGTGLPFEFLPGQYLNISLAIDGRQVHRSYTIASSPTRGGYCEITVKREAGGTSSRYLHDHVREGDLLDISAPAGRFTFTGASASSVVLIAGGVGITPLMSKIRYLTDRGWPGDIDLVFCVKTEVDIIFREELEYLQKRHPNLHVTVTLSRSGGNGWSGECGRVTPALLNRVVPQLATRLVHFCGPEEMNQSLRRILVEMGVPEDQIQFESFIRPAASELPAGGVVVGTAVAATRNPSLAADQAADRNGAATVATASVIFARSGKSQTVPAGKTVLDVAEDLGVNIDYDCRAGICGTCKIKLLSGRVRLAVEDALTPADRANRLILSCQAHCFDEVTIDA
ncbi:MAG: ferric reductase-like transmembrane domain-containing protein [Planctomycetia bacterium]|nr:ferric reductase-like transmembrane domain-containing protein [Planctomycetia bacterium]